MVFHDASLFAFAMSLPSHALNLYGLLLSPCAPSEYAAERSAADSIRPRSAAANSAGATQIIARLVTNRKGAIRDCCKPHCGANAASASTTTALTTTPRIKPNTAPSNAVEPTQPNALAPPERTSLPNQRRQQHHNAKNGKEPGDVRRPLANSRNGQYQRATRGYSQAAIRYPTITPAKAKNS